MTSPRRDVEQYGNGHGGHGGGNDLPSAIEPSSLSLSNGDAVAEDDGPSPNYVQSSIEGGTRTPNGEPAVDPTLTPLDEDDAYMSDDLRNVDAMYGSGTSQSDLRHEVTQPKEGLSAFAASLIVVNYMSAGFLLLPGAFALGGAVLTSCILAAVSFQSYLTSKFVLEACARAEQLEYNASTDGGMSSLRHSSSAASANRTCYGSTEPNGTASAAAAATAATAATTLPVVVPVRASSSSQSTTAVRRNRKRSHSYWSRRSSIKIRKRKFELSLLQDLFLGRAWNYFFTLTSALDLYGITWAFCTIFAAALAERLPVPGIENDYMFYVGIFVVIALPLSCTSILDQLYVQMAFLAARLLMVVLMVGTLLVAYAKPDTAYFGDQVGPNSDIPLANGRATIQLIQTAVFSTAFQFSVPAIGHVTNNKRVLRAIFQGAVAFIFAANLILGLLVSLYFGNNINPSNNLNWANYTASPVISYYIVLFAAIDGVAVYPLTVVSLGGILMGVVYGDQMHVAEQNWKIRTLFRFLAAIPQAIGALFVQDLGVIALYTGIFTILSYTICPALLCIRSRSRMMDEGYPTKTSYSTPTLGPNHLWAYALLGLSVLIIVGVVFDSTFNHY